MSPIPRNTVQCTQADNCECSGCNPDLRCNTCEKLPDGGTLCEEGNTRNMCHNCHHYEHERASCIRCNISPELYSQAAMR